MTEGSNDDLKVIKPDAGLAFRAEMYGTNVILGYWKVIAGVIAAFLVCVLLYGQYQNWYLQKQEETSSETAHLLKMFSDEYPEFIFAGATGDGYTPLTITENPKLLKDVRLAAQKLKEIGDSGSGSGAAYSYLMSAEFSRYAGDLELRKTALQASSNAGGLYATVAAVAEATIPLERGDVDGATASLAAVAESSADPVFQQWASLQRARVFKEMGKDDEAVKAYDALIAQFPDSQFIEIATTELETISAADSDGTAPTENSEAPAPEPADNDDGQTGEE